MALAAAAATAAGGIGGAIVGGLFGASSAKRQRKFNKVEARKLRRFQERMYESRYQNTMTDMKRAGLNPLLAYRQGTGGGTPAGAAASSSLGQEAPAIAAGAGKGIEAAIAMATKQKITQDTATSAAQQAKIQKETVLLSKEEPWALIMEKVATEGVKPLLDYLLETYGTAKKRKDAGGDLFPAMPKMRESLLPPFPDGILYKPKKGKKR